MDVVIIGGGPAGITAAIYCKRANLDVCIIEKSCLGGNPMNYSEIENYPGFHGETYELITRLQEHVSYLKIPTYEFEEVQEIDLQNKKVKTTNYDFDYKYLIIATGSKPKMLNVPGEMEYIGKGVHYCAICDGPLYKDKMVAVIGGGNSACEEALGLSKICKKVYIIEFTDKLNAERTTIDKINNTENIQVRLNSKVKEIFGEDTVKGLIYTCEDVDLTIYVDGIFPYIGMSPNVPETIGKKFYTDGNSGYIMVNKNMETTVKDVYAIGDVRIKDYRQVITAMSDGAIAAIHISKK